MLSTTWIYESIKQIVVTFPLRARPVASLHCTVHSTQCTQCTQKDLQAMGLLQPILIQTMLHCQFLPHSALRPFTKVMHYFAFHSTFHFKRIPSYLGGLYFSTWFESLNFNQNFFPK